MWLLKFDVQFSSLMSTWTFRRELRFVGIVGCSRTVRPPRRPVAYQTPCPFSNEMSTPCPIGHETENFSCSTCWCRHLNDDTNSAGKERDLRPVSECTSRVSSPPTSDASGRTSLALNPVVPQRITCAYPMDSFRHIAGFWDDVSNSTSLLSNGSCPGGGDRYGSISRPTAVVHCQRMRPTTRIPTTLRAAVDVLGPTRRAWRVESAGL